MKQSSKIVDGEDTMNDVITFWEANPLFSGETNYPIGTKEYFEEHRSVYIKDCFAGKIDERLFPDRSAYTLDLGCGPGFWTLEFLKSGVKNVMAADLTKQALRLTQKRLDIYGVHAEVQQENAQSLSFPDHKFDHVNCQGVIHHTPDTQACVSEIYRVLKPGGKAVISVYYRNILLRNWSKINWMGKFLHKIGAKLSGRGREQIFSLTDVDEITRMYDGEKNPIGKSYTTEGFLRMLESHFDIEHIFYHFFPARSLPFRVPQFLHRWLDRKLPFMIYAELTKK